MQTKLSAQFALLTKIYVKMKVATSMTRSMKMESSTRWRPPG